MRTRYNTYPYQENYRRRYSLGFRYRRKVTISAGAGASTGYQVKFLIGKDSGATGEDFDLGGKCRDDMLDIRFTSSDRLVELSYWIESVAASGTSFLATVWVKVLTDLSTNSVDIWVYYDKTSAGDASDGDSVFEEFDDFGTHTKKFHADNAAVASISQATYYGENIVYDDVTNKYWWIFYNGTSKCIGIASSATIDGTFTVDDATLIGPEVGWNYTAPCIKKFGSYWYVYYGRLSDPGGAGGIYAQRSTTINSGYAATGITNPILDQGGGGSWNETRSDEPYIFEDNGTYYLFVMGEDAGTNETTGYATATDPANTADTFTEYGSNPVISGHTAIQALDSGNDKAADPFVFTYKSKWYVGVTACIVSKGDWRVILYQTDDFINYTYVGYPLIDHGAGGNWDDDSCLRGAVTDFDGVFYFPYTGNDGTSYRMGLTTLTIDKQVSNLIDGSKWCWTRTSPINLVVGSGIATIKSNDSNIRGIGSFGSYTGGYAARGRVKLTEKGSQFGFTGLPNDPSDLDYCAVVKRWDTVGIKFYSLVGDAVGNFTNQVSVVDKDIAYHIFEVQRTSNTCTCTIDDANSWANNTDAANDTKYLSVAARNSTTGTVADWVLVRKYVASEPAYSSVGVEHTNQ